MSRVFLCTLAVLKLPGWPHTQKSASIVGIKDISYHLLALIHRFMSTLNHKGYVICSEEPSVSPIRPSVLWAAMSFMVFLPCWLSWIPLSFYIHEIVRDGKERKMKISLIRNLDKQEHLLCVCWIYYWRFDTAYWEAKDSWGGSVYTLGFLITHQGLCPVLIVIQITDNSLCNLSMSER